LIGLAFDTETTGLIYNATLPIAKQPEIIEFYGCLFDDKTGEVKEELDLLITPTRHVSEEITSITGITNAMLKGKPSFKDCSIRIYDLIRNAKFVTAHNLSYDMEMIEFEFKRLGSAAIDWPSTTICTVEQTVHLRGIRLSLSHLHKYLFNESFEGAHRAKQDVQAQVRCFMELKKRGEL